jgi:hypothetical protein
VKDLKTNAFLPLGQNVGLLRFLKDKVNKGQIDIMLHGFSHEDYAAGHEFEVGDDLRHKIEEGKTYLESLFERPVRIFVPPHNALSRIGVEAVEAMNMDILASTALRPSKRGWSLTIMKYISRKKIYSFRQRKIGKLAYVYPFMLSFSRHRELGCFPLVPSISIDDLRRAFDAVSRGYDRFCLNTHYRELNSTRNLKDILSEFVEFISAGQDNSFCLATELFDFGRDAINQNT